MEEAYSDVPENMCPKSLSKSFPYVQSGDGLLRNKIKQWLPTPEQNGYDVFN